MTVRLNDTVRNARVTPVVDAIDAGAGAGVLRVYTGTQPASVATAATGTLLLEFTLNDPSFTVAGDTATMDVDPLITDDALADGTPGWARFSDSTGTAVMDVSVGTSGTDLTLTAASVTTGQTVNVDQTNPITLTDPA